MWLKGGENGPISQYLITYYFSRSLSFRNYRILEVYIYIPKEGSAFLGFVSKYIEYNIQKNERKEQSQAALLQHLSVPALGPPFPRVIQLVYWDCCAFLSFESWVELDTPSYASTLFLAAALGSLRPPPLLCRPSPPSPSSCRFSLLLALFVIVSRPTSSVGSTTVVIPLASWSARWCHWAPLGWLIIVVRVGVRYGGVVLGSSFASGFAMPALCCPHRRSLRRRLGYGLSSSQGGIVVADL